MTLRDLLMGEHTFGLYLVGPMLAGVVLVLPILVHTRRRGPPTFRLLWAIFLVVAAAVYVAFAAFRGGGGGALTIEAMGVVVFAVLAFVGARIWAPALPLGWAVHVAWDLLLHPVQTDMPAVRYDVVPYAPWWYPPLCVGFDLVAAGFLAATLLPGRAVGRGTERPVAE